MSKKVKCPSCDMSGDLHGEDYKLVTTYRGRPVVQCFWCDTHVMIRRTGAALVLDLNHKAIRHLRSDLDHDQMVSLLLEGEDEYETSQPVADVVVLPAAEQVAAAVEAEPVTAVEVQPEVAVEPEPAPQRLVAIVEAERPAPKRKRARKPVAEPVLKVAGYEPAMMAEAAPAVLDNTPVVLRPEPETEQHDTPVPTGAELVASIPVTARALDHDSLIHIASRVGWNYTPMYKQPEWVKVLQELPPPVQMGKYRTKFQDYINMMKYFRVNAGSREQRRADTQARRLRLAEYRRRMFDDRLEVLNAMKTIEYKAKAI